MRLFTVLFTAVVLTAAFLYSCKKDNEVEIPKEFPVKLVLERWEIRETTRLFTDKREIQDQSVIQALEQREEINQFAEQSFDLLLGEPGLTFSSELVARFDQNEEEANLFDIDRKGNRFLFYSRDKISVNPAVPPSSNSLGYFYSMLKYQDKLSEPTFQGERQTREVRVAHGNYKVLKSSNFVYILNLNSGSGDLIQRAKLRGLVFNEFTDEAVKFLGPQDTLAVKEYSLIYTLGL